METARLVLEYIRVLLWPAIIVGIIWRNRTRLASLLERVTSADISGLGKLGFEPAPQQKEQPPAPEKIPTPAELEKPGNQTAELQKSTKDVNPAAELQRSARDTEIQRLQWAYQCEALWNRLYKSQIELLRQLSLQPDRIAPYQAGLPSYQSGTFWHGPKREPYDQYIAYLANAGLVKTLTDATGGSFIQLTPKGVAFLQYATAAGLNPLAKVGV